VARVLITDGDERSALAAARSLGSAGHTVFVGSAGGRSLAGGSRRVAHEVALPDPLVDPEGLADRVAALAGETGLDVVLPMTEASLLAILPARGRISAALPWPPDERFRRICDKGRVFEAARQVGIAVPEERVCGSRAALRTAARAIGFPLVVKPSRSVAGAAGSRAKHPVRHARDEAELETIAGSLPESAFPVHVQARVEGSGVGVFLLRWGGRTLARFAHRRLREKPPSGGVSVYRESIALDPELEDASTRLLDAFAWEGVAMVEYKLGADGRPWLMEINGRFWGSLQLAIDAGVDFPRLLVAAALGQPVEPVTSYRVGVRTRWVWGDVDHLLQRLLRSRRALHLPDDAGGRVKAIAAFAGAFAGGRSEVFRATDPGPAWRETRAWFRALGSGRG